MSSEQVSDSVPIYGEGFAAVYATTRYSVFSQRMAKIALLLLQEHQAPARDLLDLACGAGAGSVVFARAGYRVIGVDGSPVMIRAAAERAGRLNVALELSQQDMRTFTVPHQVDAVTCLFDALNYLVEVEDLASAFDRVATVLRSGGLFIFDMNTIHGLATRWGSKDVVSTNRAGIFEVNQNRFDAATGINTTTTTIFVRGPDEDIYRRYTEIHRERGYSVPLLSNMLVEAGFVIVSIHSLADMYEGLAAGLGPLSEDAGRVVVTARRV